MGSIIGAVSSSAAEEAFNEKDSQKIVVDELIGYYVSVFYLPQKTGLIIAAFILFRIFDIIKPVPIKTLEKTLSRGTGVVADDIMAGIYANIVLQIWTRIF